MENPNNEYDNQPLTTRVWLLLTVICNAFAASFGFIRGFNVPLSWFAAVLYITVYRFLLVSRNVNQPIPIYIDLGISFVFQCLSSLGETGWKVSFLVATSSMLRIFTFDYMITKVKEYFPLLMAQLRACTRPVVMFEHPLSPLIIMIGFGLLFYLNGALLYCAFSNEFNTVFYFNIQDYVGLVLVMESIVFLLCYKKTMNLERVDAAVRRPEV